MSNTRTITELIRDEATETEAAAQAQAKYGEGRIRRLFHRHDWAKDIMVQNGKGWQQMRVCGFYVQRGSIMLIARRVNEQGQMQGKGIGIPARNAGRTWYASIEKRALEENRRKA